MVSFSLEGHSVPHKRPALEITSAGGSDAETFDISSVCSTGSVAGCARHRKRHAEGMLVMPWSRAQIVLLNREKTINRVAGTYVHLTFLPIALAMVVTRYAQESLESPGR